MVVLRDELSDAYDRILRDCAAVTEDLEPRLRALSARCHELAGLGRETGDEDYGWLLGEVRAQLSMYRMADEVANRCVDASEALSGLAPIWLPTSALTVASAATDVAGQSTFGLTGLLPRGLMVFAKPFVKAGEIYECDCPQTPDVDVDAVLWWTAEPEDDGMVDDGVDGEVDEVLEVVALARRRGARSPQRENCVSSTLVEVTGVRVPIGSTFDVPDGARPLIEMLCRIGKALQNNTIGLVEIDGGWMVQVAAKAA
ncbi:hypothetical protein J6U32_11315 [Gordonia polyisoprenivorans]|nr:hypothetical protein J6U32_11315 [Gordonia polyisoprenivorans]